jgi:hypothetical protein
MMVWLRKVKVERKKKVELCLFVCIIIFSANICCVVVFDHHLLS